MPFAAARTTVRTAVVLLLAALLALAGTGPAAAQDAGPTAPAVQPSLVQQPPGEEEPLPQGAGRSESPPTRRGPAPGGPVSGRSTGCRTPLPDPPAGPGTGGRRAAGRPAAAAPPAAPDPVRLRVLLC